MDENDVRVEWITCHDAFCDQADAWNKLVIQHHYPIFFRHEWFSSVLQWQKPDTQLCILLIFKQNQLIGIAPLCLLLKTYHFFSWQQLEFLTVPDTPVCDLLMANGHEALILQTFFKALLSSPFRWDTIRLDYLNSQSLLTEYLLSKSQKQPIDWEIHPENRHYYVSCENSWPQYIAQFSRKLRKQYQNVMHQWLSRDDWHITHYNHLSHTELDQLFSHWRLLLQSCWKGKTNNTLLTDGPHQFLKHLSHFSISENQLSCYALFINTRCIAFEYQLIDQDCVYALRGDYHEDYQALSPGHFLQYQILKNCFGAYRRYYFGPGLNLYKARLATHYFPIFRCYAHSLGWKGRLLKMISKKNISP